MLLYSNVCSARNKWGEIAVAAVEADVLALTETWLKDYDHIPDVISNLSDTYRIDETRERSRRGSSDIRSTGA